MQNEDLTYVVQNIMSRLENLERFGVPRFATTAARDAAFSTNLAAGMVAYIASNDANEGLYVRNSAGVWRPAPWNQPWGLIGTVTGGGDTGSFTTIVDIMSGAFVGVTNRRYSFRGHGRMQQGGAAGDQVLQITDNSNVVMAQSNVGVSGTTSFGTHKPESVDVTFTGSVTYKMRATSSSSATLRGSAGARFWFGVWDDGPIGVPA